MQFLMASDTYYRLTRILEHPKKDEQRQELRNIYLEAVDGNIVAVVSNGKVLAAEFICRNPESYNWNFDLVYTPQLAEAARKEIDFGGKLEIIWTPELKMAAVKTTFGYQHPGNAAVMHTGTHILREKWRKIVPEPVKASKGAMALHVDHLTPLGAASPSGEIVFPAFFDSALPVIVRDRHDPNWLGVFIPHLDDGKGAVKVDPAIIPNWAM